MKRGQIKRERPPSPSLGFLIYWLIQCGSLQRGTGDLHAACGWCSTQERPHDVARSQYLETGPLGLPTSPALQFPSRRKDFTEALSRLHSGR